MKRLLIISPYFPPVNAADMHRVRTSLPYFKDNGWDAEVVTVDPAFTDLICDEMLLKSVLSNIKIHKVKALDKKWTSKLGLGSIALRSLWFYKKRVNELLSNKHYDLIYFSTTQFPVCILGAYWKRKFKVPYIIDMQDPWHSDYYQDKPKEQRPAKYWFSYRLNKYLEPFALKKVDGLISVSQGYIDDLKVRYPRIKNVPSATITFGMFEPDLEIAIANQSTFSPLLDSSSINIVYVGRGGTDMHKSIAPVLAALNYGLTIAPEIFGRLKFYFIGTSYAAQERGKPSIMPLAKQYQVDSQVIEITDRLSYYQTLITLLEANALFIPGSDDAKYTASKIYPYLMVHKPLLAIFNPESSALKILGDFGVNAAYSYNAEIQNDITAFLTAIVSGNFNVPDLPIEVLTIHSARHKTHLQCRLFNAVTG